jgi:hypothetical protein
MITRDIEKQIEVDELRLRTIAAEEAILKLANAIGSLGSHGPTPGILHKINRLADEAVEKVKNGRT